VDVDDDNGTRIGWMSWLATAQATTNGTTADVAVDHFSGGRGQGSSDEPQGAKHWLVYRAPGFDRLEHDPSVGIEPTNPAGVKPTGASSVPAPAAALAVLAVAAAAMLASRRRA
jgi:hypothetical protein